MSQLTMCDCFNILYAFPDKYITLPCLLNKRCLLKATFCIRSKFCHQETDSRSYHTMLSIVYCVSVDSVRKIGPKRQTNKTKWTITKTTSWKIKKGQSMKVYNLIAQAKAKRNFTWEETKMQIGKNNSFCSFVLGSSHVKLDVWPWPKLIVCLPIYSVIIIIIIINFINVS